MSLSIGRGTGTSFIAVCSAADATEEEDEDEKANAAVAAMKGTVNKDAVLWPLESVRPRRGQGERKGRERKGAGVEGFVARLLLEGATVAPKRVRPSIVIRRLFDERCICFDEKKGVVGKKRNLV